MPRSTDYIGATGIGVSDLEASARFYETALGMTRKDGSNPSYRDLPVKLVFYVSDPKAVMDRIRAAGGAVTREPEPLGDFGVIGLAKDPDGYVVELLQAPPPRA